MKFINLLAQYRSYKQEIDTELFEILENSSFIGGAKLEEFEKNLASFVSVKHAIGCSSGTSALFLALKALDKDEKDEVIVPSFTFIATAEIVVLNGLKPVFVDIDTKDFNLTYENVKKAITSKTKAVIAVSMFGQMSDLERLNELCKENQITLIEDGAQSFGASFKGKKSCAIARISCTSFFPSKPLGAYGDGGAVFTNDDLLAKKIRMLLNHGQIKRYEHEIIGINGRLDTLQAAVLNVKLKHFEKELEKRQLLAKIYDENLKNCTTPKIKEHCVSVYAQYSVLVEDRAKVIKAFEKANVPYAVHYPIPLHKQACFKAFNALSLKNTEFVSEHILSLPFCAFLSEDEQARVIEIFAKL